MLPSWKSVPANLEFHLWKIVPTSWLWHVSSVVLPVIQSSYLDCEYKSKMPTSVHLTTCEMAWYLVYNFSCIYICLSVCHMITFKSLDVGSLFSHLCCTSGGYISCLYIKVIGSGSRSHEQWWSKIVTECLTSDIFSMLLFGDSDCIVVFSIDLAP